LFASGRDRAAESWKKGYAISGTEALEFQHLYRSINPLGERIKQDLSSLQEVVVEFDD